MRVVVLTLMCFLQLASWVTAWAEDSDALGSTVTLPASGQLSVPPQHIIAALELAMFRKVSKTRGLVPRIEALEKVALREPETQKTKDLSTRVSDLIVAIGPTQADLEEATSAVATQKGNWFFNPPDVPWMNSLGHGIKNAGKGITQAPINMAKSAHSAITSPEFLMLTAAAGLVVGAYYLGKSAPAGTYRSSADYGYGPGHDCTGSAYCRVCNNCNYCAHCNDANTSNYCGVYYAHH